MMFFTKTWRAHIMVGHYDGQYHGACGYECDESGVRESGSGTRRLDQCERCRAYRDRGVR